MKLGLGSWCCAVNSRIADYKFIYKISNAGRAETVSSDIVGFDIKLVFRIKIRIKTRISGAQIIVAVSDKRSTAPGRRRGWIGPGKRNQKSDKKQCRRNGDAAENVSNNMHCCSNYKTKRLKNLEAICG